MIVELYRRYRHKLFMKGRMGVLGTTFPRFCAFKMVNYRFQLAGYYSEMTTKQVSALDILILLMYISFLLSTCIPFAAIMQFE